MSYITANGSKLTNNIGELPPIKWLLEKFDIKPSLKISIINRL